MFIDIFCYSTQTFSQTYRTNWNFDLQKCWRNVIDFFWRVFPVGGIFTMAVCFSWTDGFPYQRCAKIVDSFQRWKKKNFNLRKPLRKTMTVLIQTFWKLNTFLLLLYLQQNKKFVEWVWITNLGCQKMFYHNSLIYNFCSPTWHAWFFISLTPSLQRVISGKIYEWRYLLLSKLYSWNGSF